MLILKFEGIQYYAVREAGELATIRLIADELIVLFLWLKRIEVPRRPFNFINYDFHLLVLINDGCFYPPHRRPP